MTPGVLSNAGWIHQKHPPAKTAVLVVAGAALSPKLAVASATQPKARRKIRYILSLSCRSGRDAVQDVSLLARASCRGLKDRPDADIFPCDRIGARIAGRA